MQRLISTVLWVEVGTDIEFVVVKSENAVSVSGAAFGCTSSSESGFIGFWNFQDFVLDISIHFSTKIT